MSSAAEAVVAPAAALLLPLGAVVAVAELGVAVSEQMQRQYQDALREAHVRAQEREAHSAALALQERMAAGAAGEAVARAHVGAPAASTGAVLPHALRGLEMRASALKCEARTELLTKVAEMRARVEQSEEMDADLVSAYHLLCVEVDGAAAQARTVRQGDAETSLVEELDQLEAELLRDLPRSGESMEVHTALAKRVQDLRRIVPTQPRLVQQAIAALRLRLTREVQRHLDALEGLQADRERLRKTVCEIESRLSVVETNGSYPDLCVRAKQQREELAVAMAGNQALREAALERLLQQSRALFVECSHRVLGQPATSYVVSQVAEVLMTLGYSVNVLEPPSGNAAAYMVPLGSEVGVELTVGADGRLSTELVSCGNAGVALQEGQETEACHLLDGVLSGLRRRNCTVRERYRKHRTSGDILRAVVAPPKVVQREATAHRHQAKGGS